jgi:hypothetical protein
MRCRLVALVREHLTAMEPSLLKAEVSTTALLSNDQCVTVQALRDLYYSNARS